MRYLFILLLLFFFGCCHCPPKDLYFLATDPSGNQGLILVDEGYFDIRENWMTREQMMEYFRVSESEANK